MTAKAGVVVTSIVLVCAAFTFSGCIVVATNPWLADTSATTNTVIAGGWVDTNKEAFATFENVPGQEGRYRLALQEDSPKEAKTWRYECSLHLLENTLLLQTGPDDKAEISPGAAVPAFMLFKAILNGDRMDLLRMDPEKAKASALKSKLILVAGDPEKNGNPKEEGVVIGSWTTDLETFVRKNLKEEEFFDPEPVYSFTRVAATNAPAAAPASR